MSRRPLAPLGPVARDVPSRFHSANLKAAQTTRQALGDITNRTLSGGLYRESDLLPPIEHMHLPPPPPKYRGVEFSPSAEPWFPPENIELEPVAPLPEISWL